MCGRSHVMCGRSHVICGRSYVMCGRSHVMCGKVKKSRVICHMGKEAGVCGNKSTSDRHMQDMGTDFTLIHESAKAACCLVFILVI